MIFVQVGGLKIVKGWVDVCVWSYVVEIGKGLKREEVRKQMRG